MARRKSKIVLPDVGKLLRERAAQKDAPTQQGVREVLASFINDRLDLPDRERVTPDWIGRNHDLAVKVINLVRYKENPKPPTIGPRSGMYDR